MSPREAAVKAAAPKPKATRTGAKAAAPAARKIAAVAPAPAKRALTDEMAAQIIMRALADPQRYRIFSMLVQYPGNVPCSALRGEFDLTAPTLSHHTKELHDAGLIRVLRTGRTVEYSVRHDILNAFLDVLNRDFPPPAA